MQRSSVNDSARENMAALAKWYKDTNGSLTSAGTGAAYTLTTNAADATLSDTSLLVFRAHAANSAAPTLNRDSKGAKTIKAVNGEDLPAGVIEANQVIAVAYNATGDTYNLIGEINPLTTQGDILYRDGSGLQRLGIGTAGQILKVNTGATAPEWAAAGNVVQRVHVQDGVRATTITNMPVDNTIPQNTEGAEFMSLAITPTNASNDLYITVVFNWSNSSGTTAVAMALFKDSDADAIAAIAVNPPGSNFLQSSTFTRKISAGSTSAQTFKVRAGINSGGATLQFNGTASSFFNGLMASTITIDEVAT